MQLVGGKHRPIDPMFKRPKKLFKQIHKFLQKCKLAHPRAHGGVWDRSCFTSAKDHIGHQYIWTRDVQDCYPSITPEAFQSEMICLGFNVDTAALLTLLCTVRGAIPQGSPLSNYALNLYLWRVDQTIASFCGQRRLTYTRSADDLIISGNDREAGVESMRLVEKLLQQRGLKISLKKRLKSGFQRKEEKPTVHSIGVHDKKGTHVSDGHNITIINYAEKYRSGCKSLQASSVVALAYSRQRLVGWMHYCRQADFGPARHIRKMIEAGDRAVLKRLRELRINSPKNKWWLISQRRNEPVRIARVWDGMVMPVEGERLPWGRWKGGGTEKCADRSLLCEL